MATFIRLVKTRLICSVFPQSCKATSVMESRFIRRVPFTRLSFFHNEVYTHSFVDVVTHAWGAWTTERRSVVSCSLGADVRNARLMSLRGADADEKEEEGDVGGGGLEITRNSSITQN